MNNQPQLTVDEAFQVAAHHHRTGNIGEAKKIYNMILAANPNHLNSHLGLAHATLPGDDYMTNLRKFHEFLKPKTYVEIGVQTGKSLALAKPPTKAVGVDPEPVINVEFTADTKIFPLKSDDFFKDHDLRKEMGHDVVEMSFLDGMHLFEFTLRDFINVEKYSTPDTAVLIHDCLPLDNSTAARERKTSFWSGDPWKIIPCLKKYRPDLKSFVIPAPPTGLGVFTNLDSSSTILEENMDAILEEFVDMGYTHTPETRKEEFGVIENNWESIERALKA